jgi:hypothetical protein
MTKPIEEHLAYAVQEYNRIVEYLKDSQSWFSPGILRIDTKDEYSSFGHDSRGHWEAHFTLHFECPPLQTVPCGVVREQGE